MPSHCKPQVGGVGRESSAGQGIQPAPCFCVWASGPVGGPRALLEPANSSAHISHTSFAVMSVAAPSAFPSCLLTESSHQGGCVQACCVDMLVTLGFPLPWHMLVYSLTLLLAITSGMFLQHIPQISFGVFRLGLTSLRT